MSEGVEHATPLLAGIRVLDLTTSRAELAGRMLADLGAEVLKVEPPHGVDSRRLPPFDEALHRGESLYWAAVGVGKRSVTLDIMSGHDRDRLRDLARRADIFIESFDPGTLPPMGLGYDDLSRFNRRLIYVSVTPFGQAGPKAAWPATELTIEAAGGRVSLQGDRDRPPLPVGYPQAAFHAGARAAADAIIALNERELSGLGQHLDTSMQEAIIVSLMSSAGFPPNTGGDPPGAGDDRADPPAPPRGAFLGRCDCADGYVVVTATSQTQMLRAVPATVLPMLAKHDLVPEGLRGVDWSSWDEGAREGSLSPDVVASTVEAVRAFFRLKTKRELMEWAWESDVHLGPVNTTRDLLANPQLAARGYWQEIGGRLHPGPAVRLSRSPARLERPAPSLGHDQALVEEWLDQAPVAPGPAAGDERPGEAFAGLKVLDLSWVAVGPITAKAFADHGATVIRVESTTRVDYVRTLVPFKDGVAGINRSHFYNNLNTSKLGLALNLATAEGRALARRLADWADVIVENFTPGTMKRLGLDYETLSRDRPDLVMLSTCLMGQTGPWASYAGYGPHGAGIAGLYGITGWPDRAPCGPNGPYTDVIAPHYTVSALAAAVLERRRSGLGQHIDVSQVEAGVHFIEPLVLDETVNGRTAPPAGLDSATACPNGVYPTAGKERYIAIAVETPEQWRALCRSAPLEEFSDRRFDALAERRAVSKTIDAALRGWTAAWERRELERVLVTAGVPASVVQRMTELHEDAQLKARGFFVPLEHSEVGSTPYDGLITRFSAKKRMLHKASPCLGEDTDYVMREVLGLSPDEIADFAARGVFT